MVFKNVNFNHMTLCLRLVYASILILYLVIYDVGSMWRILRILKVYTSLSSDLSQSWIGIGPST